MSVEYTGCDICLLCTQEAVNRCECRSECKEVEPTEEQLQIYDDCLTDCENDYGDDPVYEDYCLDGCEYYLEGVIKSCWIGCGDIPTPVRTIVGYGYRLVAAWAPIPFDPRNNPDNWSEFGPTDLIEGNWVNIPDWNPPSPWPEIYDGNNRCFGIGIRIFYEDADGTTGFCDFTEWECDFIG